MDIGRGIIAGSIATLVLSTVMDPLIGAARGAGALRPTFAWFLHFFVGSSLWGAAFAVVQPVLRGPSWLRGFLFGVLIWLVAMAVVMPLTRAGFFGLQLGAAAPALMFLVHVAYGILLGVFFAVLAPEQDVDAHGHDQESAHLHPSHR